MDSVLVLNYGYTPLNITSTRRGYVLVDKGKAEIIKSDENPIVAGYKLYVRPLIIRLLNYINTFFFNKIPSNGGFFHFEWLKSSEFIVFWISSSK